METEDALPAGASARGRLRRMVTLTFTWIGIIATLLGLTLGGIEVFERLTKVRVSAIERDPLVDGSKLIEVGPGTPPTSAVITADRILVSSGVTEMPDESVWVANSVELHDGAVLRGRNITIVAREISGGSIDAAGLSPAMPGAGGEPGAGVVIAGLKVRNFVVDVSGGDGAVGTTGAAGRSGRGGRCDGFGRWRKAERGENGEPGGRGGNGGDGGNVYVLGPDGMVVKAIISGGNSGAGGAGGEGGRGGRGCVGLGGSQMNAADGNAGPAGMPGSPGADGRYAYGVLTYEKLQELVQHADRAKLNDALLEIARP